MESRHSIQDIINEKLDEIKGLDRFITKWLYEGRDISKLKLEIAEREMGVCDLKYYCKENNLKFEDYYTDRLSASLPKYSIQQALRDF